MRLLLAAALVIPLGLDDRGGAPNSHLDAEIRPLHLLPSEKRSLIAFLESLNGTIQNGTR